MMSIQLRNSCSNMKINLVAFGIAKDILGSNQLTFDADDVRNIGELKEKQCQQYPDFMKLRSLSLAVNEEYQEDSFVLSESDEVVIIPPVSGG